jgi:ribosomal protein S12 methylthiotransferase accessory factor
MTRLLEILATSDPATAPAVVGIDRLRLGISGVRLLAREACHPSRHHEFTPQAPPADYEGQLRPGDAPLAARAPARSHFDALQPSDFLDPATALAGSRSFWDLESEIPAKVAGEKRLGAHRENLSLHWGGHAGTFADSEAIGVLEGLERIAGYRPSRHALRWRGSAADLPARAVGPSKFGLASDDWPLVGSARPADAPTAGRLGGAHRPPSIGVRTQLGAAPVSLTGDATKPTAGARPAA